jgi:hypothetical protein
MTAMPALRRQPGPRLVDSFGGRKWPMRPAMARANWPTYAGAIAGILLGTILGFSQPFIPCQDDQGGAC